MYVCVREFNASTLELLRKMKEKRKMSKVTKGSVNKGGKCNFKSHVFRALTIRIGMRLKVHYGRSDRTCCALALCFVFLQLALVSASFYSPESGDITMLTPAFYSSTCVSLQQRLTDVWLIHRCFVNRAVPCWHGPYLKCSGKRGPNLVLLVTSWWTTVQTTNAGLIVQPYALIMVMVFTLKRGLDQANWDETITVLILLYV